jgi:hypothetical protein
MALLLILWALLTTDPTLSAVWDGDHVVMTWDRPGCVVWEQPALNQEVYLACTRESGGSTTLDTTPPDGLDYVLHPRLDTTVSLRALDGQVLTRRTVPPRSIIRFPFVVREGECHGSVPDRPIPCPDRQ